MEVLTDGSTMYLLNVIDAINQSDQPVGQARMHWDRCGAEVYLKTDGRTKI